MEKSRICKICSKTFANGKAMGGHMRSHLAKLPIPPPRVKNSTQSSFFLQGRRYESRGFRSRNHGVDLCRSVSSLVNRDLSVYDRESETDSPKNPTRKRSKRSRNPKSMAKLAKLHLPPPPQSVSFVSESFSSTDDAAMCLLMLSRDQWNRDEGEGEIDDDDDDDDESVENENSENDSSEFHSTRFRTQISEYRCETCKKSFGSYQALGGHRGSHKKVKSDADYEEANGNVENNGGGINQRIFECSFCYRVFNSGQALGGHKKVHLSKVRVNTFDLNLPAPEEDDDQDSSQLSFQQSPLHQVRTPPIH